MSPFTVYCRMDMQLSGQESAGQDFHIWSLGVEHGYIVPGFGVPGTEVEDRED